MKKTGIILSTASLLALSAIPVFADPVTIAVNNVVGAINPAKVGIGDVISWIVGAAVVFGILAALLFIILGAFNWITSGGDKGKVESARNHIVAAVVGLIIIVLSLVVINFVLQIIGIGSLGTGFKVPTLNQ